MTADDPLDLAFLMRDDIGDVDFVMPATTPGIVIDWGTLADADAPAAWNALREWVECFTVRYDIPESMVPACWFRHSHLVDELSALHAAHLVAFDASDSGFGPIRWHERLNEARPRLGRAYYSQCSDGHRSYTPRSWTNAVDEQAWDEWIDQPHS